MRSTSTLSRKVSSLLLGYPAKSRCGELFIRLDSPGSSAIATERLIFQRAQREDSLLAAGRLLFFDESLFRLNEQLGYGWAVDGPTRLLQRKGLTQTTMVLLTMGQLENNRMILHASLRPPQRATEALPATYRASELKEPGKGAPELREWTRRGLREATVKTLKELLKRHGVQNSGLQKVGLVALALQLKATGRLGLPAIVRRRGGLPKSVRGVVVRPRRWPRDPPRAPQP